ncbi:MAG TPA: Rieske 2Fe-2S domain-containing protein [Bryobacteraceae bacterium]|jgi:nitrite reductase/ring-hydroxylating ferredoxin subunit
MAIVNLGAVGEVPMGAVREILAGDFTFAVCNVDGVLHVVDGICPHAGGPLGHGALHGTTLVCPFHAWEFDCRTGVCDLDSEVAVTVFPVTIQDGEIVVEVP